MKPVDEDLTTEAKAALIAESAAQGAEWAAVRWEGYILVVIVGAGLDSTIKIPGDEAHDFAKALDRLGVSPRTWPVGSP